VREAIAFLPSLKKLIEAGLSYDEVKRPEKIPTTWGAKITGNETDSCVPTLSPV
jgi:hypothetical protein